jgi:hypothetical protein
MTTDSQRGDIGNLALADAALGALLTDIARLAAVASYPDPPATITSGATTGWAATLVGQHVDRYPDVFPDEFDGWLAEVREATDLRNGILHAVAVNTCDQCGTIGSFWSNRDGEPVERTDEVVHAVTSQAQRLRQQGLAHAEVVAERVNARIVATAREAAEATNEIQNPPQVKAPHPNEHLCASCDPNGRGHTIVRLGTAIEVWPREKLQMFMEEMAKPHAERDYERWHR